MLLEIFTPEVRMNRLLVPGVVGLVLLTCASSSTASAAMARRDTVPPALAPLGAEHENLRATFAFNLHRALAQSATRPDRLGLVAFLRNMLIPHAQVEELVLYPALDSVLGTKGYATATLVLDHRVIANQTLELIGLLDSDPAAFQRRAETLAVLVEHHFTSEEAFVMPNLARKMNNRALQMLLQQMHAPTVAP